MIFENPAERAGATVDYLQNMTGTGQKSWNLAGFILSLTCLLMGGCGRDNPGKWPATRVATQVAKSLEIEGGLTLETSSGTLVGTGKRADGELLSVTVTQHPEKNEIRWEAKGDRGFVETGYYALE
jgi:hypothetical protein